MSRLYRRNRDKETGLPVISLTPLIDTVLVLLVIFMVTTPGKTPVVRALAQKVSDTSQPISIVEIDESGKLHLDSKLISMPALIEHIKRESQGGDVKNIFVHPSKNVSSQTLTMVLDGLRRLHRVGIIVG